MESEVKDMDVKSSDIDIFEQEVNDTSAIVVDNGVVAAQTNCFKVTKKIQPDSPDVIRAAKRFEQVKKRLVEENNIEQDFSENYLGARRKSDR